MAHGHGHSDHGHSVTVQPPNKEKIKKIWVTAGILAFVTAIEFAATAIFERGYVLISLFVILTLVKTFYIVGEFMHLKYEVKTLIWSIVFPVLFIIWFITSMLMEGTSIFVLRDWWDTIAK